jgi:hypothetical protein
VEDQWRRHLRFGLSRRLSSHSGPTVAVFLYYLVFVMVLFAEFPVP